MPELLKSSGLLRIQLLLIYIELLEEVWRYLENRNVEAHKIFHDFIREGGCTTEHQPGVVQP